MALCVAFDKGNGYGLNGHGIMKFLSENKTGIFIAVFFVAITLPPPGIRWGLPSSSKAEMVLSPDMRNDKFYRILSSARQEIYEKIGGNPSAYAGRVRSSGGAYDTGVTRRTAPSSDGTVALITKGGIPPYEILLAMNSFLLRSEHPHEQEMLNAISKMNPSRLDFNPRFYRYGGSYIYALAGIYFVCSKIGLLTLSTDTTYYLSHPDEMAKFYIIGRALSVFSGTAVIFFTYCLAMKLYGGMTRRVPLLSAVFAAMLPVLFVDSITMRPQIYAAAWALAGIYTSTYIILYPPSEIYHDKKNIAFIILTAVCLGISLGAALNSWIYLIFPPVFLLLKDAGKKDKKFYISSVAKISAMILLCAVFVYFCTNPYVLFNLDDFFAEVNWMSSFRRTNWFPLNFFLVNLRQSLGGWTMFASFLMGSSLAAYLFFKKRQPEIPGDKILMACLVPSLLYIGIYFGGSVETGSANVRYHFPVLMLSCIMCARFFADFPTDKYLTKSIIAAYLILTIAFLAYQRAVYTLWFYQSGTGSSSSVNIQAGRWINQNIPRGASIGILKYTPHTDSLPPFRFADYKIIGDYEHAIIYNHDNIGALFRPEYFLVMENPDYQQITRSTRFKEFLDKYYVRVSAFEGKALLCKIKNAFGYGQSPVIIYRKRI